MPTRSPAAPLLSVVTPLYNCLPFTQAMLASLTASIPAGLAYEVILVDDGSTDGTREWLAGLSAPFRVVLNQTNLGFGRATNTGAAIAQGEMLALLNNDLVLSPGWLEPMLEALRALGRRAGVVGNLQTIATSGVLDHAGIRINLKGKPEHVRQEPSRLERLLRPVRPVEAATGACLLVRAETWRSLEGFDPAFVNGCEDVDLCLRARQRGLRNAVALRSRVGHHVSASPGRKRRDEENTRRLIFKWRDQLITLASREWTWAYFRPLLREPRDFPDQAEALRMAAYLGHLRPTPPATARAGMGAAIDTELARWWEMFSD